jgi:signal transduction histidine kinase
VRAAEQQREPGIESDAVPSATQTVNDGPASRRGDARRHLAVLAALAGCVGLFVLIRWSAVSNGLALIAAATWLVLVASLLLLPRFLPRSKREPPGGSLLAAERMFEQLYRIARQVEVQPQQVPELLLKLLRDHFEPLQAALVGDAPAVAQILDGGATLLVPVPALTGHHESRDGAIRLRFARRGRRAFTAADARLTERIGEQLRRAVDFDRAVEQGRSEERLRLAQDLHDDIGARLLTLMYKAQSPEIEEYVRHTLKDLKTLTRGLAASSHPLSHAAAEWKADLAQRLTAADVALGWSLAFDRDILLSMVQWSALTRILRELASNAIAHAGALRVEVLLRIEGDLLALTVADDGGGRDPGTWSHGLGLGGVRKRVRQLGGEVEWLEARPRGIECRVRLPLQSAPE